MLKVSQLISAWSALLWASPYICSPVFPMASGWKFSFRLLSPNIQLSFVGFFHRTLSPQILSFVGFSTGFYLPNAKYRGLLHRSLSLNANFRGLLHRTLSPKMLSFVGFSTGLYLPMLIFVGFSTGLYLPMLIFVASPQDFNSKY